MICGEGKAAEKTEMRRCVAIAVGVVVTQGCVGSESGLGFRLPEGNPEAGERAFWYLRCHACHDVRGIETPSDTASAIRARVVLGGEYGRVKTYGELVTAIINPSHELAPGYREEEVAIQDRSIMDSADINRVMTVQELVDIVAWLQPLYEVTPPALDPYAYTYR